jgi:hypothetical protein
MTPFPVQDAVLGDVHLSVVPGSYRKRNKRSGRGAVTERLTIDRFHGQRQASQGSGAAAAFGWDGLGVGPVFDGDGVEPWPHSATFGDSMADVPSVSQRAYTLVAGGFAWVGIGRRIYKSVATGSGTWSALAVAADLGAGYAISGLAPYQDDLLVLLSTGQEIRKLNTSTNALTVWRAGERGVTGVGYASQLVYAPRLAGANEELRISGVKWNGNAETYQFYLDAPIISMCAFGGAVIVATKQSLWRVAGRNYPGEADDPAVTADTSKAPLWTQDPAPIMSHGQSVGEHDFTFLASYRGRLFTWLGGRVAEWDGANAWTKHGPEGIACYGGCVSGDWLTVAVRSRLGAAWELWGYDGEGWWRIASRDTPGMLWPGAVGGAGGRDVVVFRDSATSYDLYRLWWRSATASSYAASGQWLSPLLDAGDPSLVKQWLQIGASFASPAQRGNPASSDGLTVSLDYSLDAGVTWSTAASRATTLVGVRAFDLASAWEAAQSARYLQLRVTWSSVSDWAPVLTSVWAEVERPPALQTRRPSWEFDVRVSDGTLRRDAQRDPRTGHEQRRALWDLWDGGATLPFVEADAGLWTPALQPGRVLWLQADQLSGLLDGDPLPAWPDATGAGPIAIQGAAANQPGYRTAQVNGKPVVRFGGDDWLMVASQLGITAQPFTQFALWKPGGTAQALMTWANSAGLLVTDLDDDVGIASGSALFNLNAHPFGQWHIVAGVHAGAGSSLAVDGGTPVTGSAGSGIPTGSLTIGAGAGGADRWLDGDLFALVIMQGAATAAERQRMEGYLAWQVGLASLLPGNHPFKAAPPLRTTTVRITEIEEKTSRTRDTERWGESVVHLVLDGV